MKGREVPMDKGSGKRRKYKLLFINYSLGMGGIETLLLELCRHLVEDGKITPSICVFEKRGHIRNEFEALGVPVHVLKKREGLDITLPWRVRNLIKEHGFDLVHAHNQGAWLYGGMGTVLAGCKLLYTEHSTIAKYSVPSQKRLRVVFRRLAKKTTLVTTVAKHLVHDLMAQIGVPEEKILTIYNGIDASLFQVDVDRKSLLKELGVSSSDKIVGILASLTEAKDHATLLNAFAQVVSKVPESVLLICGAGPLETTLKEQAESQGLIQRVRFLGVRRDVANLLKVFNVFVLSSVREGLPVSILEAMAAGCPVVATNIPGNAELVEHGRSGLLVSPRHPEKLAESIVRVLQDTEFSKMLAETGRKRVAEEFSFDAMIRSYLSLYEHMLSGKPISRP